MRALPAPFIIARKIFGEFPQPAALLCSNQGGCIQSTLGG